MHIIITLSLSLLTISSLSLSMDQRSLMQGLLHKVDKEWVNRVQYITDIESAELCEDILKFNPTHPQHVSYSGDSECFNKTHRAFEREQKLMLEVEDDICQKGSYAEVEQIVRDVRKGYISQNIHAIIHGYLDSKIKRAEEDAEKLKKYRDGGFDSPREKSEQKMMNIVTEDETDFISPTALQALILDPTQTYAATAFNYIRKSLVDPIGYLTSSKSSIVSRAVLHFDPAFKFTWPLNSQLPLHCMLIHNAFERQMRLLDCIEAALQKSDDKTIVKLLSKVEPGYVSENLRAVTAGFLTKVAQEKQTDTSVRREQADNAKRKDSAGSPSSTILPSPPVELPPAPAVLGKTPPAAPPKPKITLSESTRKSLDKTKLDIVSANELENDSPCPCQSGKTWGECHSPATKP